jgi:hypothetical protein
VETNVSKTLLAAFVNMPCDAVDIATEKHPRLKRDTKVKRADCGTVSRHREVPSSGSKLTFALKMNQDRALLPLRKARLHALYI